MNAKNIALWSSVFLGFAAVLATIMTPEIRVCFGLSDNRKMTDQTTSVQDSLTIEPQKPNSDGANIPPVEPEPGFFPKEKTLDLIKVKIESVQRDREHVVVYFKLFNDFDSKMEIRVHSGRLSTVRQTLINHDAEIYYSSGIGFINEQCADKPCTLWEYITEKSWVKGTVKFENIPTVDKIDMLQICFSYLHWPDGDVAQNLILRNVPIESTR